MVPKFLKRWWKKEEEFAFANRTVRVLVNGNVKERALGDVREHLGVDRLIRVVDEEYERIPHGDLYGHFNLGAPHHAIGKRYALPRIVEHGFYNEQTEENVSPVLSFEDIYFGTCVDIACEISYEQIEPRMFEHSMSHITSVPELKRAILNRYRKSRTTLSEEKILSMPVSWTLLKLEGRSTPAL